MYVSKMKTAHARMLSFKINQLVMLNKHIIFSTSEEIANIIISIYYVIKEMVFHIIFEL